MTDDSSNFSKYFTNPSVLEGIVGKYSPPAKKVEITGEANHTLPKIISGKDFPPAWELESRPFLVDGLFQRGDTILLSAPPKLGKSFFWGNASISLATGTPFLGKETTKSNVLIIDLELRRDVAMDRLIKIAQANGFDKVPDNVYLWSLARHTYHLDTICEVLKDELSNLPKIDLCVVDPLFVIDNGQNYDENNAHAVANLIISLERLTTEQDSALGLCHHTRKGNLNNVDSIDRSSGSSSFSRYPSVLLNLSRHEEENCVIMESTTRNFKSPSPMCFELDAPVVKNRPDLDPSKFRKYGEAAKSKDSLKFKILHALPSHSISKQEWFARCRSIGASEEIFIDAIDELIDEGAVRNIGSEYAKNSGQNK